MHQEHWFFPDFQVDIFDAFFGYCRIDNEGKNARVKYYPKMLILIDYNYYFMVNIT